MKMNRFFGMVIAGIVAVSSLACVGEDNEDGEEDRIVVYNTPDGEYLYDKKFKFFGRWSEVETNDEERYRTMRFVPDETSRLGGGSLEYYDDYFFDKDCYERIPTGTYKIWGRILFDGDLEKLSENDVTGIYEYYAEWSVKLGKYDCVNMDNKNRNIVNFQSDHKYCYLTGEEEKIDFYVRISDGVVWECVKYENNMDSIYRGRSTYLFVLGVDLKDIECFSYDDLVERKEPY